MQFAAEDLMKQDSGFVLNTASTAEGEPSASESYRQESPAAKTAGTRLSDMQLSIGNHFWHQNEGT